MRPYGCANSTENEGKKMIKMPILVNVKCDKCGWDDEVYFSEYGAEQSCFNCDAAPIYLSKVGA